MTPSSPLPSAHTPVEAPPLPALVDALTDMFPGGAPLHVPHFAGNEWDYVKECLDTGWVSTAGAFVGRFEDMIVGFTGARHAIATVNGTAALHSCLMLADIQAGDEVIVPALTFVATANVVAYCGAVPHFADCTLDGLGLDVGKLDAHLKAIVDGGAGACVNRHTGRPVKAVICMHTLGHPVDIDALEALCERYGLALIEDAAESLGSYYKGRHTGSTARFAALSFNGNKIATTGGGGAILTDDDGIAERARHLTTTAKRRHPYEFDHDIVGYNYRLPNINAAIGCAQIEQLPGFLAGKRRLAQRYAEVLGGMDGVDLIAEPEFARSNFWLNAVLLDDAHAAARDPLLETLNEKGIQARPAWVPMHRLPMFKDCPRMDLATTESVYRRLIDLPSGVALADP